jgi:type VI secretion system VasI family protein
MFRKLFLTCILLPLASNAIAEVSNKEIAKCAAVKGDLSRLDCYDKMAQKHNLNAPQTTSPEVKNTGSWRVSDETNPIDDSRTVTLILEATSGKSKWNKNVFLVARCKSNTTNLYIGWNDYLGSEAYVLTRIGNNKAVTSEWSLSTDSQATFHTEPIPFLKNMLGANKLIAQITPYNENPVTAIFDTSGLKNALKPLRETCNW